MLTKIQTVFKNHFKTGFKFVKYFSLFFYNFIQLSFKSEENRQSRCLNFVTCLKTSKIPVVA